MPAINAGLKMKPIKYLDRCLADYKMHRSKTELVRCILEEAEKRERKKCQVRGGTRALVKFSRGSKLGKFIPLKRVKARAPETMSSPRGGLWPWVYTKILEEQIGPKSYKIKQSFFTAMLELFPEDEGSTGTHRIMELAGLGREIWVGVDPDEYVERERSSWDG